MLCFCLVLTKTLHFLGYGGDFVACFGFRLCQWSRFGVDDVVCVCWMWHVVVSLFACWYIVGNEVVGVAMAQLVTKMFICGALLCWRLSCNCIVIIPLVAGLLLPLGR